MSGAPPSSDEKYMQMMKDYEERMLAQADAPLGAPQQVQTTLTLPHIIRVVTINVLILVELFIAMYMAVQNPEEFTSVFFKVLFALIIPTLLLGIYSKRFIRPPKEKQ